MKLIIILLCAFILASCVKKTEKEISIFSWKEQDVLNNSFLEKMEESDITRIFQSFDNIQSNKKEEYFKKVSNFQVFALCGDSSWYKKEKLSFVKKKIREYSTWNNAEKTFREWC